MSAEAKAGGNIFKICLLPYLSINCTLLSQVLAFSFIIARTQKYMQTD